MKVAYFDCFAGASGDMILGSLLDAGLDVERLKKEMGKLHLTHYDLGAKKVSKKGMGGTQAVVTVDEDYHSHHHHDLHHIKEIIEESDLERAVKQRGIEIFTRLAEAEAKVHRTTMEHVHFHEVGAMDAIIDVMGAVAGFAALGIEKVYCSPLHVGTGTVECAHGTLPVPAPATVELIRGKPIYSTGVNGELLTPTGAAILTTLSSGFGPMPAMTVERVGYGAGTSELAIPNLLRVVIGEARDELEGYHTERVAVVEATIDQIDEMDPQTSDHLTQKMLDMGALDVFLLPVQMKKDQAGTLLTVICVPEMVRELSDYLMRETTATGLRWRVDNRIKAKGTAEGV
ncbi:MAG: nickel pincer cofactor biosynthesis protein LarC [Desulfobacterales bacterium]|nr:nickel pincer cofactor biosynthesis protein LarC [Desulfobacterales bacterium]